MIHLIILFLLNGFLQQEDIPLFLMPGSTYSEYEFGTNYKNKKYKGVFIEEGQKAKIKEAKVQFKKEEDDCGGEVTNQKSVNVIGQGKCILILDLPILTNHDFDYFSINDGKALNPGYIKKITLNNTTYTIAAIGLKGEFKEDPYFNIKKYSLTISALKGGKLIKQTLVKIPQFNERYPSQIYLAGDIDGDGNLDLLLEGGDSYAGSKYFLYLSSKAKIGQLMGKVSEYQFTSC